MAPLGDTSFVWTPPYWQVMPAVARVTGMCVPVTWTTVLPGSNSQQLSSVGLGFSCGQISPAQLNEVVFYCGQISPAQLSGVGVPMKNKITFAIICTLCEF